MSNPRPGPSPTSLSQPGGNQEQAGGSEDRNNSNGLGERLSMKQFLSLLRQHAQLAVVHFHIPHLLARIQRRERGGRIGGLRRLSLTLDPILRAPNQDRAAEAGNQNHDPKPIKSGAKLSERDGAQWVQIILVGQGVKVPARGGGRAITLGGGG